MRPRVALLVVGDGRDALREAMLASFYNNARELEVVTVIEVDDRKHELGFCGAIRSGWERLRAVSSETPFDYVWHAEEDWLYDRPFDVSAMAFLLDCAPAMAQVALRRGPHGPVEEAAGGFLNQWPDEFREGVRVGKDAPRLDWLAHRLFWTTNPSLYRRELIEDYDWPEPPGCEAEFTRRLLAHDRYFAYWGTRAEPPRVIHTGLTRTGVSY